MKELETIFKNPKLKVKIDKFFYIGSGKFCEIKENYILVYDEKFEILNKIRAEENLEFLSNVIELDNNDIICAYEQQIIIYFKNKNYNDHQIIFPFKESEDGYIGYIKKFSRNKFMIITNFGINIYFLNKENYEIGFKLEDFGNERNLKELSSKSWGCFFDIHVCEINENEFIFIKEIFFAKRLNEMSIDKFILNEKTWNKTNTQNNSKDSNNQREKDEINIPKIKDLKTIDIILNSNKESKKENKDMKSEKNQKLIRYDCKANEFYLINIFNEITVNECYFSDYVILKKKYFIVINTCNIMIYNLSNLKLIKDYIISNRYIHRNGKREKNVNIIKWNSPDDNMFLLVIKKKCANLTLFELNELNEEILISLKVIGYTYILNKDDLYKYEDKNKFYQIGNDFAYLY